MLEYIEGFRSVFTATVEGLDIYSIQGWDGRTLFQGSKEECRRYAKLYRTKVAEHEERVRSSRRVV